MGVVTATKTASMEGPAVKQSRPVHSIAIASIVLTACSTSDVPAPTENTLSQLVSALSENGPGCAVSLRENGKLTTEYAKGYASLDRKVPLKPTDLFDIGSVSKSFTAAVAMDLAQKGTLDLTSPVSAYIDGLPDWGTDVSVSDILYMKSGIPDFLEGGADGAGWRGDRLAGSEIYLDDPASFELVLGTISKLEDLHFEPGSEFEYSNSNYMLLRAVTEKASGQTFEKLVHDIAREKAGIDVRISDFIEGRRTSESHIQGHDLLNGSEISPFLGDWDVLGASSLWVSPHDLALWGEGILAEVGWFERVSTPGILQIGPEDPEENGYGAGLMTLTIDDEPFVYHLGGTEGFSSGVFMRPEKKQILAFSCNTSPELTAFNGITGDAASMFMNYEDLVFLYAWLGYDGQGPIAASSPGGK